MDFHHEPYHFQLEDADVRISIDDLLKQIDCLRKELQNVNPGSILYSVSSSLLEPTAMQLPYPYMILFVPRQSDDICSSVKPPLLIHIIIPS